MTESLQNGARRAHTLMLEHPGLRIELQVQKEGLRLTSRCQHPLGGNDPHIFHLLRWSELSPPDCVSLLLDRQLESLRMHVLSIIGPR